MNPGVLSRGAREESGNMVKKKKNLDQDPVPFEHRQDTQATHINADDELTIPVHEEDLTARKRQVERGSVDIQVDVTEQQQTLDVPVTDEKVTVSRRRVDRDTPAGDDAFEDGTLEVPVRGEEVNVEKRTRVREEIEIDRHPVTHEERVSGTARREEVNIDGENVTRDRVPRRS